MLTLMHLWERVFAIKASRPGCDLFLDARVGVGAVRSLAAMASAYGNTVAYGSTIVLSLRKNPRNADLGS